MPAVHPWSARQCPGVSVGTSLPYGITVVTPISWNRYFARQLAFVLCRPIM